MAVASVFIGSVLGEYEMRGLVPILAGGVVGLLLGETTVVLGRWRGPAAAVVAAAGGALSLLLAGWIDSTQGVEPYPAMAAIGAVLGAAVAAARVLPQRHPAASARDAGGHRPS